jgi:hypothetical protein
MTERTKAWQCIGCGRIESQATCLGICEDRPVLLVSAADYDQAQRQLDELRLLVRQLAQRAYKALQEGARRLLGAFDLPQDGDPRGRQAA